MAYEDIDWEQSSPSDIFPVDQEHHQQDGTSPPIIQQNLAWPASIYWHDTHAAADTPGSRPDNSVIDRSEQPELAPVSTMPHTQITTQDDLPDLRNRATKYVPVVKPQFWNARTKDPPLVIVVYVPLRDQPSSRIQGQELGTVCKDPGALLPSSEQQAHYLQHEPQSDTAHSYACNARHTDATTTHAQRGHDLQLDGSRYSSSPQAHLARPIKQHGQCVLSTQQQYPPEVDELVNAIRSLPRTKSDLPYRLSLKSKDIPIIRQNFCARNGILKPYSVLSGYIGDTALFDEEWWEYLTTVRERLGRNG